MELRYQGSIGRAKLSLRKLKFQLCYKQRSSVPVWLSPLPQVTCVRYDVRLLIDRRHWRSRLQHLQVCFQPTGVPFWPQSAPLELRWNLVPPEVRRCRSSPLLDKDTVDAPASQKSHFAFLAGHNRALELFEVVQGTKACSLYVETAIGFTGPKVPRFDSLHAASPDSRVSAVAAIKMEYLGLTAHRVE